MARNSTVVGVASGICIAATGGWWMIPMSIISLCLCGALRAKEDSESPEALSKVFEGMYQNNPAVQAHVDKVVERTSK